MEKLLKLFDDLAEKYNIEEDDRKQFAEAINNLGGEIKTDGEDDFSAPAMGDDDEHEAEEAEPAFR
jgi:hypothetical protein